MTTQPRAGAPFPRPTAAELTAWNTGIERARAEHDVNLARDRRERVADAAEDRGRGGAR